MTPCDDRTFRSDNFYPRNDVMFVKPMSADAATHAWRGWAAMNHLRSAVVLTALLAELGTLTRVAQTTAH